MAGDEDHYSKELMGSLRKIMQSVDIHSKNLKRTYGLTGPQLLVIEEVVSQEGISVSELAISICLSRPTVTDIVNRLERKKFISKKRSEKDKRRVMITPLSRSYEILEKAPPLLQETFTDRFESLEQWEQLMLISSLNRIVHLMSAEK